MYGNIPCLIFHDVDLIPLNGRNIYGCSIEGPRHLSANVDQFRYLLPYEDLFGGAIALSRKLFQDVDGFSNQYFGKFRDTFETAIATETSIPLYKGIEKQIFIPSVVRLGW